jgi:hypothetical protein
MRIKAGLLLLLVASAFTAGCCTWPYRCEGGRRHWYWHHGD